MSEKLIFVMGTRPEAIKLAPLIQQANASGFRTEVLAVMQHTSLLTNVCKEFGIKARKLTFDRLDGSLPELIGIVTPKLNKILKQEKKTTILVVQGDTMTAYLGALVGFLNGLRVVHVEAGLRTRNTKNPFPEEMIRQSIARMTALHCAPTVKAKENLEEERVPGIISVTGNTIVDAVRMVCGGARTDRLNQVYMTIHRRENETDEMLNIFGAVKTFCKMMPEWRVVFPCHPAKRVQETARKVLKGVPNLSFIDPVGYTESLALIRESKFVLTDSGGIQEEAGILGVPAIVCRETTERMESVNAGASILIGSDKFKIIDMMRSWAMNQDELKSRSVVVMDYGDGKASKRILEVIRTYDGEF